MCRWSCSAHVRDRASVTDEQSSVGVWTTELVQSSKRGGPDHGYPLLRGLRGPPDHSTALPAIAFNGTASDGSIQVSMLDLQFAVVLVTEQRAANTSHFNGLHKNL